MSKSIRSLAACVSKSVNRLTSAPRLQKRLPVSVSLDVIRKAGSLLVDSQPLTVTGKTSDLSKTGIGFVLPFIRLGEHYLAGHGGEQKRLKIILELPTGTIRMTVTTERYEMIQLHDSVQQYLIGANIVEINEGDRERYEHFLLHGGKTASTQTAVNLQPVKEKRSILSYLSLF